MIEIDFLGTGGAVATKDRDNTSFLIHDGHTLVLVDCPGSVIQKVKKLDRDPREISTVLITHIHPDHIYGLPSFVHSLMLEDKEVRIYGSDQSIQFCRKLLDLFRLQEEKIRCRIDFTPLRPGEKFQLAPMLTCSCLSVPHHASSLAFRFCFEKAEVELFYSGDTPVHPPVFREAEEIDYLLHDCSAPARFFQEFPALYTMHTHSRELGEMAQQAGVKSLIPCHFFGELDFDLQEIEGEIKEHFQGKLVIPGDFDKVRL
jgi:ribonuclease Z